MFYSETPLFALQQEHNIRLYPLSIDNDIFENENKLKLFGTVLPITVTA